MWLYYIYFPIRQNCKHSPYTVIKIQCSLEDARIFWNMFWCIFWSFSIWLELKYFSKVICFKKQTHTTTKTPMYAVVFGLHSLTLNSCVAGDCYFNVSKVSVSSALRYFHCFRNLFYFPGLSLKEEWWGLLNMKKKYYWGQGWIQTIKIMHFFTLLMRISLCLYSISHFMYAHTHVYLHIWIKYWSRDLRPSNLK